MTVGLIAFINSKIKEEWSPEQISGWLREEQNILISHETIYRHIWSDKQSGGQLFQSRSKNKQAGRGFIKNRISIDEWPPVVEDKSRIGDWEIDLVLVRVIVAHWSLL